MAEVIPSRFEILRMMQIRKDQLVILTLDEALKYRKGYVSVRNVEYQFEKCRQIHLGLPCFVKDGERYIVAGESSEIVIGKKGEIEKIDVINGSKSTLYGSDIRDLRVATMQRPDFFGVTTSDNNQYLFPTTPDCGLLQREH